MTERHITLVQESEIIEDNGDGLDDENDDAMTMIMIILLLI